MFFKKKETYGRERLKILFREKRASTKLKLASFGRMVNFCTLPALCSERSLALPIPAQTADLSSSSLGCERKSETVSIRPRSDSLGRPRTLDMAEEKEAG